MTRTLRIGIASLEAMKARTIAMVRGKHVPDVDEPKIWFTSAESFGRVLSAENRALLGLIAQTRPSSISALARSTGRAQGNLSRTLATMAQYGLVRLTPGPRGSLVPEVDYDRIAVTVDIVPTFANEAA